jgi:hypothetical protein
MSHLTRPLSSTANQPPSASTSGEQAAALSVSDQPTTIRWLVCPSPLCGTRWAETPRRKPGSRCGDMNRGWFGDCKGRLVAVSGRAAQ